MEKITSYINVSKFNNKNRIYHSHNSIMKITSYYYVVPSISKVVRKYGDKTVIDSDWRICHEQ